jgi:bacillithiol synthase
MPTDCVTYQDSGYFSKIITDYLDQVPSMEPFYNHFPSLDNFALQISEKAKSFNQNSRKILVSELEAQYVNIKASQTTLSNIKLLEDENTYTITTGHQLNLFTGPLYFLYKIVSVLNLCKELKQKYPNQNFVPIYWMATEDHDFEEINYFSYKNKKIKWDKNTSGPVGRLDLEGLKNVFEVFSNEIGFGENAKNLGTLFEEAYLQNHNLAEATRVLTNKIFASQGLVIIDGDNQELKKIFAPLVKDELINQNSFFAVSKTIQHLKDYKIQVNPREINLFFIENGLRERIIFENDTYKINNTNLVFTTAQILKILEKNPEKFSPNVILRPLYQEVILPNLCYIGGGGELAYWLELKNLFNDNNITFPMLLLRNSVVIVSQKQIEKMKKLKLSWKQLFQNQQQLVNDIAKKLSKNEIDFSKQKMFLSKQFEALYKQAKQTDKSFRGAVAAQEKKQMNGLDYLEKRLLVANKRKNAETINRVTSLQNEIFPNQSLQERQLNFSEFFESNGDLLIQKLLEQLNPLSQNFEIIVI